MAFNGKYELVKDEGQLEHLLAAGLPEDRAKTFLERGKSLELSINGNTVSLTRSSGEVQSLTLNKETEETSPDGIVFKTTPPLDGDKLIITSKSDRGDWKREFSVNGAELTVTSISDKAGVPNGRRIYKRV